MCWTRGQHVETEEGTPQGAVISPLLANVYLHYVYDLWVQAWRRRYATGDMIVVRYADDTIVGFQRQGDATRFLDDLKERLAKFALELHPTKRGSSLSAGLSPDERRARGEGRPETFDFLGFTHICGVKQSKAGRAAALSSCCERRGASASGPPSRRSSWNCSASGTIRSTNKAADWPAC